MKFKAFLTSSFICSMNQNNTSASAQKRFQIFMLRKMKFNTPGTPCRKCVHHPDQYTKQMPLITLTNRNSEIQIKLKTRWVINITGLECYCSCNCTYFWEMEKTSWEKHWYVIYTVKTCIQIYKYKPRSFH